MKNLTKRLVSLFLTLCLLLSSAAVLAEEEGTQAQPEVIVEETLPQETLQEKQEVQAFQETEQEEQAPVTEETKEEVREEPEPEEIEEEVEIPAVEANQQESIVDEKVKEEYSPEAETKETSDDAEEQLPVTEEVTVEEATSEETGEKEDVIDDAADENPASEEDEETPADVAEEAVEIEEEPDAELLQNIPDSLTLNIGEQPAYDRLSAYPRARNWELSLDNPGRLAIYVNPTVDTSYSGSVTVNIWNNEVNQILATSSGGSAFVMDNIWLDAGNYNIVVDGGGINILYSMRATFTPVTDAIIGYQSYDAPYTLNSSTTFTRGIFTVQDRVDYFLFTVSEASHVSIVTRVYEPGVVIRLYDATNMTLGDTWTLTSASEANPRIEEHDEWLEAGRYFIFVQSTSTGIYDIYANAVSAGTVDQEPNDGRGTAIPITVGSTYQGMISMLDTYDYYEIKVSAPTEVEISLRECTDGLDAVLWDKNMGTVLANFSSAAGSGSSQTNPVEKYTQYRLEANQSYYLQIKKNSKTGLYSLALTKKLTVESVSVSQTSGGYGTTFRIIPTVSGGTPVNARYELYKQVSGSWILYWTEWGLNPYWDITAYGDTAAQRATWGGTWAVLYRVYDGYSWTSSAWTSNFVIGSSPVITSISVGVTPPDTVYVGVDFDVSVTVTGSTPTLYVYDIIDSHNSLLKDRRVISTAPTTKMHVDGAGTNYHVMVTVFDSYGQTDVKHSTAWQPAFNAVSKLTVNSLYLQANGTLLTASLSTSYGTPVNTRYDIYCNDAKIDSKTVVGGNTFNYTVTSGGSYYVTATCYNGSIWLPSASSNVVSVAEAFEVFSVDPSVTTATIGSAVTFSLRYSGTVRYARFYLNRVVAGVSTTVSVWEGTTSSHTFTLPTTGAYAVYAVVSDGAVWKHAVSGWVNVMLTGATVVSVTTDRQVAAAGQTIKATLVSAGDATVQTTWYLVNNVTGATVKSWTGNSHNYTFTVQDPGTYVVVCAVFGYYGDVGDFKASDPFNIV